MMDNEQFFELKMKFGLQKLVEELGNTFTASKWLNEMEKLDQDNKDGGEYVPTLLKDQHARVFLQKIRSVMVEHISKEIDLKINKTNIKKQMEMLQNTQIIRMNLQQCDIPIDDRDIFFQETLTFDDLVEDGILSVLQKNQLME